MICGLIFPGDSRVSLADVEGAAVVTAAVDAAAATAAAAVDFLDNTVAVYWVGEIILGDVSVKVEFKLAMSFKLAEVAFVVNIAVDVNDGVVVTIGEIIGSFNVVIAAVEAIFATVAAVVPVVISVIVFVVTNDDEEGDDKYSVAFFVYGGVALLTIGLDVATEVIIVTFFPPAGIIDVPFFPLTESSGRPFDDAGTADAVISNINQIEYCIARIILNIGVFFSRRMQCCPF